MGFVKGRAGFFQSVITSYRHIFEPIASKGERSIKDTFIFHKAQRDEFICLESTYDDVICLVET